MSLSITHLIERYDADGVPGDHVPVRLPVEGDKGVHPVDLVPLQETRAIFLEEVQQDLAVRVRRPLRLEVGVVAFQILLELLVVVDLAVDGEGRVSVLGRFVAAKDY